MHTALDDHCIAGLPVCRHWNCCTWSGRKNVERLKLVSLCCLPVEQWAAHVDS